MWSLDSNRPNIILNSLTMEEKRALSNRKQLLKKRRKFLSILDNYSQQS